MNNKITIVIGGFLVCLILGVSVYFSQKASTPLSVTTPPEQEQVTPSELSELVQATTTGTTTELTAAPQATPTETELPVYTKESLAPYNGENSELPIYIALERQVYDVTPGKEYYQPGGVYHFLAGTDGTTVLRFMGGDIIKRKYKIVGTFRD